MAFQIKFIVYRGKQLFCDCFGLFYVSTVGKDELFPVNACLSLLMEPRVSGSRVDVTHM